MCVDLMPTYKEDQNLRLRPSVLELSNLMDKQNKLWDCVRVSVHSGKYLFFSSKWKLNDGCLFLVSFLIMLNAFLNEVCWP